MANHSDYNSDGGYSHGAESYGSHGSKSYKSYSDCDDLSEDHRKVLRFSLGHNKSGSDNSRLFAGILAIAIIFTLFFVLMNLPSFDYVMAQRVPGYSKRLAVKAFLFLFLVVIISLMVHFFYQNDSHHYRDDCDDDCEY